MITADVGIVGGGVAGLTVAVAAADSGLSVAVVDMPASGAASRAAAGMLAPSLDGLPDSVLQLALAARDYYPDFLAALTERSGETVELNRLGVLELAAGDEDLSVMHARAHEGAALISPAELQRLEPALAPHAGAVLHPHDGAVDNVQLMVALERAVGVHPGIVRVADRAMSMRLGTFAELRAAGGAHVSSRWMVLAGGAWVNNIDGLPRPLPVRPVRGQLLSIRDSPVRHVTYAPGTGYLVPRGGTLGVGATSEESGFLNLTTSKGRRDLMSVVSRTLPGLAGATVLDHWAGLRPMTPDNLPILGPDPLCPSLLHAGGFSRNGILLAPWAARELAALMASERLPASLDSFSLGRFGAGK